MTPDPIYYILAASIIGSLLGFFTAALLASRKIHALEKATWAVASAYYQRKADPTARRL